MTLQSVYFAATQVQQCVDDVCDAGQIPKVGAGQDQIKIVLQIVFGIIGIVALIYIFIAGFQLVTSLGNPEALKKARQSIIFAVVGLLVALSAEIIVNLVLGRL